MVVEIGGEACLAVLVTGQQAAVPYEIAPQELDGIGCRVDEIRAFERTTGNSESANGEGVPRCQLLLVTSRRDACCTTCVQYRPGLVDDRRLVIRYLFAHSQVPPALEIGLGIEAKALCKHVKIVAQQISHFVRVPQVKQTF